MNWFKIEIQKGKLNTNEQAEQIDLKKAREYTDEIVREEIKDFTANKPAPLTKEDIEAAVYAAVIRASVAATPQETVEEDSKIGFWKAVWLIIRGKASKESRFATALMSGILSVGFNFMFGFGIFFLAAIGVAFLNLLSRMVRECGFSFENIVKLVFTLLMFVLTFLISLLFKGAANDIKKEEDRNYIVALFSGVVSFVALIISIVALFQKCA